MMRRRWILVSLVLILSGLQPVFAFEAEAHVDETREKPLVQVGLERVATGDDQALRGKRLGLVAHAASVTSEGKHAIDVLQDRGLKLVRLFSPEHGLRSRAAAGEQINSGVDPASGLQVVSLYGLRRKPTADDLANLDALVFDLQDVGVRFYTYVSTMILCMEAADEAGLEFVVLDRPNPLGGNRAEGPLSDPRTVVPERFVNMAPGPLVHGLTLGEMARYVNSHSDRTDKKSARLTVIPMRGWQREMSWPQTGRPWVAPSPNLRSPQAALAYPGVALLEATNISEGRGTSTPFLLFGAPWLDPDKVHLSEPGFTFEPASFKPQASPAAAKPKHLDQACRGFRVVVHDTRLAQPYRMGLALLLQLKQQPEFEWRRSGEALTWLVGTARLFEQLKADKSIDEILAADSADHNTWRAARKSSLLY